MGDPVERVGSPVSRSDCRECFHRVPGMGRVTLRNCLITWREKHHGTVVAFAEGPWWIT
jgi:hypothetical protein